MTSPAIGDIPQFLAFSAEYPGGFFDDHARIERRSVDHLPRTSRLNERLAANDAAAIHGYDRRRRRLTSWRTGAVSRQVVEVSMAWQWAASCS